MRIIFVGMHHKPGMTALDSKTMTGKTIDQIINEFPEHYCYKTNLCETDYQPPKWMMDEHAKKWISKHDPVLNDVVILLGAWVRKHLRLSGTRVVLLKHPAGVFGKKDDYIRDAVEQINQRVNS